MLLLKLFSFALLCVFFAGSILSVMEGNSSGVAERTQFVSYSGENEVYSEKGSFVCVFVTRRGGGALSVPGRNGFTAYIKRPERYRCC